jgi:hypothetical protein
MAGSLLSARCITFIECRRSVRPRPYPGKGNAPLAPFYTENHLFYQDRLGTYIGTTQKKVAFSLALQLHEQARYDYPRGRIHRTATEALQVQVHWYDEHPCWDGWRCGTLCRAGCDNRDTLLLRAAPGERDSKKKRPLSLSLSLSLSLFGLVSALPLWFCPEPVLAVHHRVSDAPSPKRPLRFSFLSACFSRFLHSLRMHMQGFKDSKVKKRSF